MKALVFVIIAVSFTSISFAQNCGLVEADADVDTTSTWLNLRSGLLSSPTDPDHWKDKEAEYYINTASCPAGAVAAINAAAATWNASSWQGANDFTFISEGSTQNYARKKDGQNVIAFQPMPSPLTGAVARTYVMSYEWWPIWHWPKDRLKDVDVIFNVNKYWATAPTAGAYDIESVALHEFGHWLVIEDLESGPFGCDEYLSAVMYSTLGPGITIVNARNK